MDSKYSGTKDNSISEREKNHREIIRRIAREGIVLLENDGILPLKEESKVSVYGGGSLYTIKGGTGSGSVNNRYSVSVAEGIRNSGLVITNEGWLLDYAMRYEKARQDWIDSIYCNSVPGDFFSLYLTHASNPLEMPKGAEITPTDTDTALYVISRISGEGADRKLSKGDYYLSETEEEELSEISKIYKKVIVVLNVGGVIDTSFKDKYNISALVLLSQAGEEGGNSLADVLTGKVNPSGKLTDTWAVKYTDYPGRDTFSHLNGNLYEEKYNEGIYVGYRYFDSFNIKPEYPFGYGLSYTTFNCFNTGYSLSCGNIEIKVKVTNTGKTAGKEVVFVFASCPEGRLTKEKKKLIGFKKTKLINPGEECDITVCCDLSMLESYHSGKSAYILERGNYYILAGNDTENLFPVLTLTNSETTVTEQLSEICPLLESLKELKPDSDYVSQWRKDYSEQFKDFPCENICEYIKLRKPEGPVFDEELINNARKITEKLTLRQKVKVVVGTQSGRDGEFIGNASVSVPGAAGETTSVLKAEYGVDNMILADGPAGIRILQKYQVSNEDGTVFKMDRYQGLENRLFGKVFESENSTDYYQFCSAVPIGTLLAQTFDTGLCRELGELIGREMAEFNVTLWLAPGMNIHRNPLCGRNFEYYSEDPLVSGHIAAAITEGVQKDKRCGTTIKHFACNNQEDNRMHVNSVVSERALREIYLKGFEIAVKKSQPLSIMTSYNKLNGVHTANSYDLCTVAARNEWGFSGIIMTDWTTTNNGNGSSAAKCIYCGNDLIMPGNKNDAQEITDAVLKAKNQSLDIKYLDECCERVIYISLKTHSL